MVGLERMGGRLEADGFADNFGFCLGHKTLKHMCARLKPLKIRKHDTPTPVDRAIVEVDEAARLHKGHGDVRLDPVGPESVLRGAKQSSQLKILLDVGIVGVDRKSRFFGEKSVNALLEDGRGFLGWRKRRINTGNKSVNARQSETERNCVK